MMSFLPKNLFRRLGCGGGGTPGGASDFDGRTSSISGTSVHAQWFPKISSFPSDAIYHQNEIPTNWDVRRMAYWDELRENN